MEPVTSKVTTTIMLQPDLRDRLDDAAAVLDRSRSWLAGRAIERFLSELSQDQQNSRPVGHLERGSVGQCPAENNPDGGRDGLLRSRPATPIHEDVRMDTATNTRASALSGTYALHAAHLGRIANTARDRAEAERQQRERVTRQNLDYIDNLGGESQ